MDKRLILAIALAILVMTGYQFIVSRLYPVEEQPQQFSSPQELSPAVKQISKPKPELSTSPAAELSAPTPAYRESKDLIVDTNLFRIVFTDQGGRIKSYRLKKYQMRDIKPTDIEKKIDKEKNEEKKRELEAYLGETVGRKAQIADLEKALGRADSARARAEIENQIRVIRGVELVSLNARYHKDYPLSVVFPGVPQTEQWDFLVCKPDKEKLVITDRNKNGSVTFSCVNKQGLELIKRFTFFYNSYSFQMDISIKGEASQDLIGKTFLVKYGPGIGQPEIESLRRYGHRGPVARIQQIAGTQATQIKREKYNRQEKTQFVKREYTGEPSWVALENKYFMVGLAPSQPAKTIVVEKDEEGDCWVSLATAFSGKPDYSFMLYLGPKHKQKLEEVGVKLEEVIEYGLFGPIAKLIAVILDFFYKWTHNYGWAIILLALSIKILFYPLTHRSFEAMKKMQDDMKLIQPELNELKERHKDNPQKLNKETMDLYRRRGVNPLSGCKGGCLPLLLQMPVFIALYVVLHNSIELRGAPFFGWITDLSTRDPYYILPILMGLSTIVQQKVTGMGGGGAQTEQTKMMIWIMPLFLVWIFARFPSGIVLYWFAFNVFTTLQQLLITKVKAGGRKVEVC